jgi:hypothetical protein
MKRFGTSSKLSFMHLQIFRQSQKTAVNYQPEAEVVSTQYILTNQMVSKYTVTWSLTEGTGRYVLA